MAMEQQLHARHVHVLSYAVPPTLIAPVFVLADTPFDITVSHPGGLRSVSGSFELNVVRQTAQAARHHIHLASVHLATARSPTEVTVRVTLQHARPTQSQSVINVSLSAVVAGSVSAPTTPIAVLHCGDTGRPNGPSVAVADGTETAVPLPTIPATLRQRLLHGGENVFCFVGDVQGQLSVRPDDLQTVCDVTCSVVLPPNTPSTAAPRVVPSWLLFQMNRSGTNTVSCNTLAECQTATQTAEAQVQVAVLGNVRVLSPPSQSAPGLSAALTPPRMKSQTCVREGDHMNRTGPLCFALRGTVVSALHDHTINATLHTDDSHTQLAAFEQASQGSVRACTKGDFNSSLANAIVSVYVGTSVFSTNVSMSVPSPQANMTHVQPLFMSNGAFADPRSVAQLCLSDSAVANLDFDVGGVFGDLAAVQVDLRWTPMSSTFGSLIRRQLVSFRHSTTCVVSTVSVSWSNTTVSVQCPCWAVRLSAASAAQPPATLCFDVRVQDPHTWSGRVATTTIAVDTPPATITHVTGCGTVAYPSTGHCPNDGRGTLVLHGFSTEGLLANNDVSMSAVGSDFNGTCGVSSGGKLLCSLPRPGDRIAVPHLVLRIRPRSTAESSDSVMSESDEVPSLQSLNLSRVTAVHFDEGQESSWCPPGFFSPWCTACPASSCALPPCSGHGTCDDTADGSGRCACASDPVAGFWSGGDCSVCSPGYHGARCTLTCPGLDAVGTSSPIPCAGHGRCDSGVCACDRGFALDALGNCTTCAVGHFGLHCMPCPGAIVGRDVCSGHGTCDDGVQGSGTCQCTVGFSGLDCQFPCKRGSCGHGSCQQRGCECEGGWSVDPSSGRCDVCDNGRFGPNCHHHCPRCVHGHCGDGEAGSGTCHCDDGFWGDACSQRCASANCSGHGTCSQVTGQCVCVDNTTAGHWYGEDCAVCHPAFNTSGCLEAGPGELRCPISSMNGAVCGGHGRCTVDGRCLCDERHKGITCDQCRPMWSGAGCRIPCLHGIAVPPSRCDCSVGFGGLGCSVRCPASRDGSLCGGHGRCGEDTNGRCSCDSDWFGPDCTKHCSIKTCAASGLQHTMCSDRGECVCLQDGTRFYDGSACDRCADGVWGAQCDVSCQCSGHGSCDRVMGTCQCFANRDQGYWSGRDCSVCTDGFIGLQCQGRAAKMTRNVHKEVQMPLPSSADEQQKESSARLASPLWAVSSDGEWHALIVPPFIVAMTHRQETVESIAVAGQLVSTRRFRAASIHRSNCCDRFPVTAIFGGSATTSSAPLLLITCLDGQEVSVELSEGSVLSSSRDTTSTAAGRTVNAASSGLGLLDAVFDETARARIEVSRIDGTVITTWESMGLPHVVPVVTSRGALTKVRALSITPADEPMRWVVVAGTSTSGSAAFVLTRTSDGYTVLFTTNLSVVFLRCTAKTKSTSSTDVGVHCLSRTEDGVVMAHSVALSVSREPLRPSTHQHLLPFRCNESAVHCRVLASHSSPVMRGDVTASSPDIILAPHGVAVAAVTARRGQPSTLVKWRMTDAVVTDVSSLGWDRILNAPLQAVALRVVSRELVVAAVAGHVVLRLLSFSLVTVGSVSPRVIDSAGSAEVTVLGEGFDTNTSFWCSTTSLEGTATPREQPTSKAVVISGTELRCAALPYPRGVCRASRIHVLQHDLIASSLVDALHHLDSVVLTSVPELGMSDVATTIDLAKASSSMWNATFGGGTFHQDATSAVCLLKDASGVVSRGKAVPIASRRVRCEMASVKTPTSPPAVMFYSHDGHIFASFGAPVAVVGPPAGITLAVQGTVTVGPQFVVASAMTVLPPLAVQVVDQSGNAVTASWARGRQVALTAHDSVIGHCVIASTGVASVSGLTVTAPKAGKLRITASVTEESTWAATVSLTVIPGPPAALALVASQQWRYSVGLSSPPLDPPPRVRVIDGAGNAVINASLMPPRVTLTYRRVFSEPTFVERDVSVSGTLDGTVFTFHDVRARGLHGRSYSFLFEASTINIKSTVAHVPVERCGSHERAIVGTATCEPCPPWALCNGTTSVRPMAGAWRGALSSSSFYECPTGLCVASDPSTGETRCRDGHHGPLCTSCSAGYGKWGSECKRCPPAVLSWVLVAGAGVLALGLLTAFVEGSVRSGRGKIVSLLRITLTYLQLLAIAVLSSEDVPGGARMAFETANAFVSLDITSLVMSCTFAPTFLDRYLPIALVIPVFCFLYGSVTAVMGAVRHIRYAAVKRRVESEQQLYTDNTGSEYADMRLTKDWVRGGTLPVGSVSLDTASFGLSVPREARQAMLHLRADSLMMGMSSGSDDSEGEHGRQGKSMRRVVSPGADDVFSTSVFREHAARSGRSSVLRRSFRAFVSASDHQLSFSPVHTSGHALVDSRSTSVALWDSVRKGDISPGTMPRRRVTRRAVLRRLTDGDSPTASTSVAAMQRSAKSAGHSTRVSGKERSRRSNMVSIIEPSSASGSRVVHFPRSVASPPPLSDSAATFRAGVQDPASPNELSSDSGEIQSLALPVVAAAHAVPDDPQDGCYTASPEGSTDQTCQPSRDMSGPAESPAEGDWSGHASDDVDGLSQGSADSSEGSRRACEIQRPVPALSAFPSPASRYSATPRSGDLSPLAHHRGELVPLPPAQATPGTGSRTWSPSLLSLRDLPSVSWAGLDQDLSHGHEHEDPPPLPSFIAGGLHDSVGHGARASPQTTSLGSSPAEIRSASASPVTAALSSHAPWWKRVGTPVRSPAPRSPSPAIGTRRAAHSALHVQSRSNSDRGAAPKADEHGTPSPSTSPKAGGVHFSFDPSAAHARPSFVSVAEVDLGPGPESEASPPVGPLDCDSGSDCPNDEAAPPTLTEQRSSVFSSVVIDRRQDGTDAPPPASEGKGEESASRSATPPLPRFSKSDDTLPATTGAPRPLGTAGSAPRLSRDSRKSLGRRMLLGALQTPSDTPPLDLAESDPQRHAKALARSRRTSRADFLQELTRKARKRRDYTITESALRWFERLVAAFFVVSFVVYPTLVKYSGRLLVCRSIDYGVLGARSLLSADMAVDCASPKYHRFRAFAIAALVVFGLGVPAASVLMVRLLRRVSHDRRRTAQIFQFVVGGYKPHLWFWESVMMARKAAIAFATVGVADPTLRSYVMMWVIAAGFILDVVLVPFRNHRQQVVDALTMAALAIQLNLVQLFPLMDDRSTIAAPARWAVLGLLLAVNVVVACAVVWALSTALYDVALAARVLPQPLLDAIAGKTHGDPAVAPENAARLRALHRSKIAEAHPRTDLLHRVTAALSAKHAHAAQRSVVEVHRALSWIIPLVVSTTPPSAPADLAWLYAVERDLFLFVLSTRHRANAGHATQHAASTETV